MLRGCSALSVVFNVFLMYVEVFAEPRPQDIRYIISMKRGELFSLHACKVNSIPDFLSSEIIRASLS